jgi:pSer/pThr/pTyr-binding forkhead associated (FHA) protein
VNEQRVRRWRLRDGDIIQIGEHQFHYVDLRDPSAPSN